MITKTFQFDAPDSADLERKKVKIVVGTQEFDLADDLTGLDVLEAIAASSGGPGSTRGIMQFLHRVVKAEDWDKFNEATKHAKPQQLGEMVAELIDAYAAFPTTPDEGSSNGHTTIGNTSESNLPPVE